MNQRVVFPSGGGAMGDAVRSHDWRDSPLGSLNDWPEPLRNSVNLMLNSPESMYLVWGEAHTFLYNDAYLPILGLRADGALGQPLPVLWADAWEAVRPSMELAWQGEASRFVDVPIRMNRYGEEEQTWWSYSYSPIYDGERVAGVFCFTTETTARVLHQRSLEEAHGRLETAIDAQTLALAEAEEALRQSQKMDAIGQLTGGLAHDFNNLLAGISGSIEMLRLRVGQQQFDDLERYIEIAQRSTRRAAALTHRLLAFARRQQLAPVVTDMNVLVSGMEELVRRTVGPAIELEVQLAPQPWTVMVDPPQLENALLNLCLNARDAMPDGGRIEVAVLNLAGAAGEQVALQVKDNGCGMPADVVARVFEPFFTTKPTGEGTGLGLSMIYGFAHQSNGDVGIKSRVGVGTEVCIVLPRHVALPGQVEEDLVAVEAAAHGGGATVLVVDDESDIRGLAAEALEAAGFRPICVPNALDALDILRQRRDLDLLVTDVGLPGMNGRQLADAARHTHPELGILFMTGYAESALVRQGELGERMDVLTKPFALDALVRAVGTLAGAR